MSIRHALRVAFRPVVVCEEEGRGGKGMIYTVILLFQTNAMRSS